MGNWLTLALVLGVVLVTSFTSMGLLALWAATSRLHWLVRSAVVLALLTPLLLIPAYEPWIVFALQACVVVAGVKVWRWWRARRRRREASDDSCPANHRFRFSLRTLLATVPLVATLTVIVTQIVRNMPEQNAEAWTSIVLNGVSGGMAVLLGAWMFVGKRKRIVWPVAFALCLGLAAVMAWFDWSFLSVTVCRGWPPSPRAVTSMIRFPLRVYLVLPWFAVALTVTAGVWLMVRVWFAGASVPEIAGGPQRRNARRMLVRCVFAWLLVAVATPSAFIVWELLYPLPIPNIPSPQPNGMDDIVAAGVMFSESPMMNHSGEADSASELAAAVAKHAEAYERLRLGLSRHVRASNWSRDGQLVEAFSRPGDYHNALMSASHGLMREAELAKQQRRYGDAAMIALENMQMGQTVTRDGLLTDYVEGCIVETIGVQSMCQVLSELDANQCREVLAELVGVEDRQDPLDDVLHRDRIWHQHASGWFGHFYLLLKDVASTDAVSDEHFHQGRFRREAVTRLLILELAIRAFQLERGELPDRLEQLTPDFLDELPSDPFDPEGRPLRYQTANEGHVVYSINIDGKDDRGRPSEPVKDGWTLRDGDGDLRVDVRFPLDGDVKTVDCPSDE